MSARPSDLERAARAAQRLSVSHRSRCKLFGCPDRCVVGRSFVGAAEAAARAADRERYGPAAETPFALYRDRESDA